MSLLKTNYEIEVDKSVSDSKALFETYFKDMAKKGYSMSTVVLNPDYGRKKFTGTLDSDGVYNARLIVSRETDEFYKSAPINKISFAGNDSHTRVNVSVETAKYAVLFAVLLLVSVIVSALVIAYAVIIGYSFLIPIAVALILIVLSCVPLVIARHRVNAAKEELIYIFKYSDK